MKKIFSIFGYVLLALATGFLIFSLSVWLRNLPFLYLLIASPLFDLPDKLSIFFGFLTGVMTSFGVFSGLLILAMAILFGVNTALFAYYLRSRRRLVLQKCALGGSALLSSLFGIGCAACGSLLASTILASFGASSIILLLPLAGEEFSILSIILLSLSIYSLLAAIKNSRVCYK